MQSLFRTFSLRTSTRNSVALRSAFPQHSLRTLCSGSDGGDTGGRGQDRPASKWDRSRRSDAPLAERSSPYKTLCKLTLIGRTGREPEVRHFDDGGGSLVLSVATNHFVGGGERDGVETQWHRVYVHGNVSGFDFLSKLSVGSQVYVEGNMRVRTVDRDGQMRQYVNVMVSRGEGMVRVLHTPRHEAQDSDSSYEELPF